MPDSHPSGSILAVNCSLKAILLPANTRTPLQYTLTIATGTISAGETEIDIASITPAPTTARPLILEDGTELLFGSARVIVKNDDPNVPRQTFTVGTAGVLKVLPLVSPLPTAGNTATTLGLLEMLGLQGIDENKSTSLISIRSQKSGLGNEQRATMVSYEVPITGWLHQRDFCMSRVIEPANDGALEVWAECLWNSGKKLSGVAMISNLNNTSQMDDVMKTSFTLMFQGVPQTTYEVI